MTSCVGSSQRDVVMVISLGAGVKFYILLCVPPNSSMQVVMMSHLLPLLFGQYIS